MIAMSVAQKTGKALKNTHYRRAHLTPATCSAIDQSIVAACGYTAFPAMFKIDPSLGTEELEAKILRIDPDALRAKLEAHGAVLAGHFNIEEQRYFPTERMIQDRLSARLRKLCDGNRDIVELVLKQKRDPLCIPGHESLGPVVKSRMEYEVKLEHTNGNGCRYALMKLILEELGLQQRDNIVTARTRYVRGKIHYEIDRILAYNGRTEQLPPPFLEIEGPTPYAIAEAAVAVGYPVNTLSALSKRDLIQQC